MRTLVTAFEAFGGVPVNPSEQLLRRLDSSQAAEVHTLLLPVSFAAAPVRLRQALRRLRPERVIALGVAPSRRVISLEKVALNWCDARIPDNDQAQPLDQALKRGAPAARFARWPLAASLSALRTAGIPCELSLSAGSFVCNAVYFALLESLARRPTAAVFVHVPPDAAAPDGLPLALQWRALQCLLAVPTHSTILETEHAEGSVD